MATRYLHPQSNIEVTNWGMGGSDGGGTIWEYVNESASDVAATGTSQVDLMNYDGGYAQGWYGSYKTLMLGLSGDIDAGATISSVTLRVRLMPAGPHSGDYIALAVRISGVDYQGSSQYVATNDNTILTETWATNPATSGAWTPAAVNGLKIGLVQPSYPEEEWVYAMELQVDGTDLVAGGGGATWVPRVIII